MPYYFFFVRDAAINVFNEKTPPTICIKSGLSSLIKFLILKISGIKKNI